MCRMRLECDVRCRGAGTGPQKTDSQLTELEKTHNL
jgi:hypothetical protein